MNCADNAATCATACGQMKLPMQSWNHGVCTCVVPRTCEAERNAAEVALGQTNVTATLLTDCSGALIACESRGGR